MAAVVFGLIGGAMLAVGLEFPWPTGRFINGIWDLAAVVGVIVSVGLLENV